MLIEFPVAWFVGYVETFLIPSPLELPSDTKARTQIPRYLARAQKKNTPQNSK